MPAKFHVHTQPTPPRFRPEGKLGIVDWREDCSSCHNCVKKGCVYGLYREEADALHEELGYLDYIYQCKGCLTCIQNTARIPAGEGEGKRPWSQPQPTLPAMVEKKNFVEPSRPKSSNNSAMDLGQWPPVSGPWTANENNKKFLGPASAMADPIMGSRLFRVSSKF